MATITPTCVFIDALIFFIVWYVLSSLWDAHLVLCVLEHFHSWSHAVLLSLSAAVPMLTLTVACRWISVTLTVGA